MVFAVYSFGAGYMPCCNWYCVQGSRRSRRRRGASWLAHGQVPTMASVDKSATLAGEIPDEGPLGSGKFVATVCRTAEGGFT